MTLKHDFAVPRVLKQHEEVHHRCRRFQQSAKMRPSAPAIDPQLVCRVRYVINGRFTFCELRQIKDGCHTGQASHHGNGIEVFPTLPRLTRMTRLERPREPLNFNCYHVAKNPLLMHGFGNSPTAWRSASANVEFIPQTAKYETFDVREENKSECLNLGCEHYN